MADDIYDAVYDESKPYMTPTDDSLGGGEGALSEAGAEIKAFVDELSEEFPLGRFVYIYAVGSWMLAIMPLVLYLFVSLTKIGAAFSWIINIHQLCWWPVAIAHSTLSIWDSEFTRKAFEISIWLSMAGPLFLYWVGFARMWMAADAF